MGLPSARPARAALAVALALTAATACGAETLPAATATTVAPRATAPPPSPPGTPTTAAPSTTAPTPTGSRADDEAAVRATVDRYWDAWFRAVADPPDPDNPDLAAVLTGIAWIQTHSYIEGRQRAGQFIRLPAASRFRRNTESVSIDTATSATVRECILDDSEAVTVATGAVSDNGLETLVYAFHLQREGDRWIINQRDLVSEQNGATACAAGW